MQNKWMRFATGCLVVRFGGDYLERFFNMCRMHNIDLWDITRDEGCCSCKLHAADFTKLPPLLRKTGTKAKVLEKRGLPFYIPFMKKRIIFFVGVLACMVTLNVVTDYVWAIEYVGNLQVSDDELTDFVRGEGIHYGMKKEQLNCEEKEKRLREAFPTVTWTSIWFEGTKLYIEVKENEKPEPVTIETRGTDIVATDAGTIVSIVTRNGVPVVKAGDTVEQGQILVEGRVPVYDESRSIVNYQIYDADADIRIQTPVSYSDKIAKSYPVMQYTGVDTHARFIEIFGYRFDSLALRNRLRGRRASPGETVTQRHQLVLLGNIYLPVYYGEINRKEYYLCYLAYTPEEMKRKLTDNFEKYILSLGEKGVQIVEKNVKIVQNRDNMEMQGEILVVKSTGESVAILAEEAGGITDAEAEE
ncbi:MAG: sporulation protein YqfD [Roseburia sp.]|nr:sporulation protein YqfD [Roseburia sp.]